MQNNSIDFQLLIDRYSVSAHLCRAAHYAAISSAIILNRCLNDCSWLIVQIINRTPLCSEDSRCVFFSFVLSVIRRENVIYSKTLKHVCLLDFLYMWKSVLIILLAS